MSALPLPEQRAPRPTQHRRRIASVLVREAYLALILLVLAAIIGMIEPRFATADNLRQVALSATLVSIVAIGQALVIIARQIDISVGPIVATSAFVAADFLASHPDTTLPFVFLMGCGIGAALGCVNAVLVAGFRIPAIVATLGTFAIFRGGIITLAGGNQISATVLPRDFAQLAEINLAGVPILVWVAIVLVAIFGWIAGYTRFGRNLYAIGSNPEGAKLAGIDETRHVAAVFVISGLLSGFVGVLWSVRFGTVHAAIAPNLHVEVILAAVLGGVSIFGGSGTIAGAVIGALIIAVLQNGVLLLGVNQFWIQAMIGAAILATVMFYSVLMRRSENRARLERRTLKRKTPIRSAQEVSA